MTYPTFSRIPNVYDSAAALRLYRDAIAAGGDVEIKILVARGAPWIRARIPSVIYAGRNDCENCEGVFLSLVSQASIDAGHMGWFKAIDDTCSEWAQV